MSILFIPIIISTQIYFVRSLDTICTSNISRIYIANLISKLSENHTISVETLQTAYNINRYLSNSTDLSYCSRLSNNKKRRECFLAHCVSIEDILDLHSISNSQALTVEDVYAISPDLLYQITACNGVKHEQNEEQKLRPPSEQAWGFGFLCVTIINMCSLAGAVVLPCMKKTFYRKVLIFMVALAVGTLSATGLLVLMPEALGLMHTDDYEISEYYLWKASTVLGGIYLFFLIEKFLKAFVQTKQHTKHSHGQEYVEVTEELNEEGHQYLCVRMMKSIKSSNKYRVNDIPDVNVSDPPPLEAGATNANVGAVATIDNGIVNGDVKKEDEPIDVEKKQVATVAWMIIFGDGLHNFIDGLTIGAAFTDSILAGVSISVSCFCEELPHELGDFAILLNAGMSIKKALISNFLSACICYLGLIAGTFLGENTTAHDWIFAIAGGMFLYISLVDMMPEMSNDSESEDNKKNIGGLQIFILQNLGMLSGYAVILVMALYGSEINFEK